MLGREGLLPARPPPGGAGLFPIAGVRGLQEAGPRAFDARAAAGPCSTGTSGAMRETRCRGGFGCRCTGAVLDDPWSPWSLTFDHAVPGDAKTLVVAAWWVKEMRTALSEGEFWKVVIEYDR